MEVVACFRERRVSKVNSIIDKTTGGLESTIGRISFHGSPRNLQTSLSGIPDRRSQTLKHSDSSIKQRGLAHGILSRAPRAMAKARWSKIRHAVVGINR